MLFLLAFCCAGPLVVQAQTHIGFNFGLSTYEGDLAPSSASDKLSASRTSFGAFAKTRLAAPVALRGFVQRSAIKGDDALRPETRTRNLSFESDIWEFGLLAEVYPLGRWTKLEPYLVGGMSWYHFDPKADYQGELISLQPLSTEGQGLENGPEPYRLNRWAVPVGFGIHVPAGQQLTLSLELSARLTFFDHLDDVSGRYVSADQLLAAKGPMAVAMADRSFELNGASSGNSRAGQLRGDPEDNDWFYVGTVALSWRLPEKSFKNLFRKRSPSEKCYQF